MQQGRSLCASRTGLFYLPLNRLAGLVQAPLLCRLGAPEAARLPRLQLGPELDGDRGELAEHRGELERDRDELEGDWGELECLLAAAELARRG